MTAANQSSTAQKESSAAPAARPTRSRRANGRRLTTQQGIARRRRPEHAARRRPRAGRCSRTSTSARRSSTSTTSASPSGSCTPAATARTATSRTTSRWPTSPAPTSSSARASRRPAFVRFSTVAGNKGSPDLARDVRGFAVKLYTQEGNWDLVGNNIPVFFIQDAIKFPDLIHAAKQEPDRGFPQAADRARQLLGLRLADARSRRTCSCGPCRTGRSRARSASWRASASTPSGS